MGLYLPSLETMKMVFKDSNNGDTKYLAKTGVCGPRSKHICPGNRAIKNCHESEGNLFPQDGEDLSSASVKVAIFWSWTYGFNSSCPNFQVGTCTSTGNVHGLTFSSLYLYSLKVIAEGVF